METVSRAVTPLKSLEANMSATIPEAAVPETAATSGANLVNPKPSATAREIAVRLRTGDKSRDGVIESEDRNFAGQIGICPGNRKRSQGSRSEESRHEKDKDAAKVRRQHRDRVQEGAAFELYSG